MIDRFRRRPLYAACNEDTRTELAALAPTRADTVVCVAAGGGRALSLLGGSARRFLAVDQRESQLHVLELSAAALDALAYESLRGFAGLDADAGRLDVYASLRPSLSPRARRYWDARPGLVARGVLYAGRLETALARFAGLLRATRAMRWPTAAFRARSLEEQREILFGAPGDVARGGRAWAALFHPALVALVLQDPSFRRSTEGRTGAYLHGRMLAFAARRLLRESFLLHLIWFGRYDPAGALPLWLTAEGAERARKQLGVLELRHATLADVATTLRCDGPMCWSLSDVSAWLDEAAFRALVEAIVAASPAGSRLCWRHLAACWPTPALRRLAHDDALSQRLERADSSVFYAIHAASVREPA